MFNFRSISAFFAAVFFGAAAQAATLGLATSAPTVGARGVVDYLEFADEGDLSMFGANVFVSSLTTLDVASARLGFGVGFDLSDPEANASGGFVILDDLGLYLSGDLAALGFRGFRSDDGIVELQFGNLMGRGASEWTDTLLMNVIFDGVGGSPFTSFVDGEFYDVEIGMFAVVSDVSEIPLPAGAWLLLGGLVLLVATKRERGRF